MANNAEFEAELQKEIEERLSIMQEPDYVFPEALSKVDWAFIVAIPVISIIALVVGEFL